MSALAVKKHRSLDMQIAQEVFGWTGLICPIGRNWFGFPPGATQWVKQVPRYSTNGEAANQVLNHWLAQKDSTIHIDYTPKMDTGGRWSVQLRKPGAAVSAYAETWMEALCYALLADPLL